MKKKSNSFNRLQYLGWFVFITLLYALTGISGLFLVAIPPGFATPIWIPSGIALGATLVLGRRMLPAIFLGSFVTNFYVSGIIFSYPAFLTSCFVGTVIALGAVFQAFAGWYFIHRWVGLNNRLNYPNDILLFALLSGPVSCLVNTTWSNTILFMMNIVPLNQYLFDWSTWWIGDCIGVLIFTPIFLILFARPHSIWRQRIYSILVPLCLSFAGVMMLYLFVSKTGVTSEIWPVLMSGLLFCVLINAILFIVHGQKNIVQMRLAAQVSALKIAEEKNLLILRSAGEGIFGVDIMGKITFINPTAARMLGYTEHELLGQSAHAVLQHSYADGKPYPSEKSPIYTTFQFNKTCNFRNEVFWRKNGEQFWVDYTCSPLIDRSKVIGAVVVFNDMTQQREIESTLQKMAHYDSLTLLPNRYSFLEKLTISIENAKRTHQTLVVCFIDLDNFKQINDNLGHAVGDETLKRIPQLLQPELTRSDYLARLGGDEFAIIIENIVALDEVKLTLQRYIATLNKPIYIEGHEIVTSFSIGAALYPMAGRTAEELIKNADIAMYKAKDMNKNTFAFFDEEMKESVQRMHQLNTYLYQALPKKEFYLEYQPMIDCQTKQLMGLEALLRWDHPALGLVSPGEFIPLAEQNGMIHEIGEWVIEQSIIDYQKFVTELNDKNILLSINISILQFEKENFLVKVKDHLKHAHFESNILIFEITESGLMRHPERTIKMMNDIKKLGVRFALDDFGVRYSSMQYLKNLPISLLKIDQTFIHDITTNSNDAAIVKAIIQLSHGLGISTIVEGVETKEQFEFVKALKTEYVQGFYFSKALPPHQLIPELKRYFIKFQ